MKKYIYLIFIAAASLLWACNDAPDGSAGSLSNVSAEGNIGSVVLKWTNPDVANYYYTVVSYVNSKGETVKQKVSNFSVDPDKGTGFTKVTIPGFDDTNTYEFTLTPYTADGWPGESTTVSGTPEDASMAYKYVAESATATSVVEGARVKWVNEWNIPVVIKITYKDLTGTTQTKTFNSSSTDSTEVLAFIDPTTISVTSSNTKGQSSDVKTVSVTPLRGEIPWSRMKLAGYSSYWEASNPWTNPVNLITETSDPGWCWHTEPFDASKQVHPDYVTIDLGTVHMINWVETVRRLVDYTVSPDQIGVNVSTDGTNFTEVGRFDFDQSLIYNHAWKFDPVKARYVKLIMYTNYPYTVLRKVCIYYADAATHYAAEAAAELMPDPDDDETVYPDTEYLIPRTNNPDWLNHVTAQQTSTENTTEWTYNTTGNDSWLFMMPLQKAAAGPVMVFRYTSTANLMCEFFWIDNGTTMAGLAGGREDSFNIVKTDKFKTFKMNFKTIWTTRNWSGKAGSTVRFDIGDGGGQTVVVRNMHWRAATDSD